MKPIADRVGRAARILLPLTLVLPFLIVAVIVLTRGVPDYPASGDGALLEMSTRRLFSHRVLLGPYSRFVFFHPGPMYFLVRFPLYALFGWRALSFLITTALIGLCSLAASSSVFNRCASPRAALVFCTVFGAFLAVSGPSYWLSEWNPMVIALPLLLFFVCAAAVGSGNGSYAIPGILAGSFAAQTHLGSVPAIVITGAAALVLKWFPRIAGSANPVESKPGRRVFAVSAALLLVLWAPPLYEELASSPQGNITRILVFMDETMPEHGFQDVYGDWSRAVSDFEVGPLRGVLHGAGILNVAVTLIPPARVALLVLAFLALRRKKPGGFPAVLCLLCIVLHAASLYSGLQIRGERLSYLFEWMRVLAPLSLSALIVAALELRETGRRGGTVTAAAAAMLLMYFTARSSAGAAGFIPPLFEPVNDDDRAVAALSAQLEEWLLTQPERFNLFVLRTPGVWPVLTGVANTLDKHGCMAGMDGIYAIRIPPPSEGVEVRTLHIGRSTDPSGEIPGTVASFEGIVVVIPPE